MPSRAVTLFVRSSLMKLRDVAQNLVDKKAGDLIRYLKSFCFRGSHVLIVAALLSLSSVARVQTPKAKKDERQRYQIQFKT